VSAFFNALDNDRIVPGHARHPLNCNYPLAMRSFRR
jgi:hypothetical protein